LIVITHFEEDKIKPKITKERSKL